MEQSEAKDDVLLEAASEPDRLARRPPREMPGAADGAHLAPDAAEVVAREVLTIFFDVFGYRAEQQLTMTLHRGSRSEQRPVHTSLSPEDFTKIAEQSGFRASLVVAESNSPVVTLERGQFKAIAIFGSPIARHNLFRAVLLRSPVQTPSPMLLLNTAIDDEFTVARFVADGDERVMAESSLTFDGGVTTEWVGKSLNRWRRAVRKYQRAMKNGSKQSVGRVRTIKSRVSVH